MSGRFDGKDAFVTGATSGIGRATALAFAREGASVVVADVAADGNQETARMIEQAGGRSLAVACDVTRGDEIKAALDAALGRFGRLDIAFNNAGIEQPIKPTAEITDDEWDRLVAVNLRGVFVSIKHEIELMLHHGGGAVVNASSGAGVKGRGSKRSWVRLPSRPPCPGTQGRPIHPGPASPCPRPPDTRLEPLTRRHRLGEANVHLSRERKASRPLSRSWGAI